jgi:hypothetical protein
LLLSSLRTLAKGLLANTEELIGRLLLRLPIGLLGLQSHALLLLGRAKRLPIALLVDISHCLTSGKVLLLRQDRLGNFPAITAEGARSNLIAHDLLLLLLLLLPQCLIGRLRHRFGVRRHIGADIQAAWRNLPRASKTKTRGHTLIRLRGSLGAGNVLSRRSLQWRRRCLTTVESLRGPLIIRLGLRRAAKQ